MIDAPELLTAGPELDALIERRIFGSVVGYPIRRDHEHVDYGDRPPHAGIRPHRESSAGWSIVPYYSVEMNAAWQVVAAIDARGWAVAIEIDSHFGDGIYRCRIGQSIEVRVDAIGRIPEAICRAALEVMRRE